MNRLLSACIDTARFASLFARPAKNRAQDVYDLLSTRDTLAQSSRYLNLGYWENASRYDEACEALARLLGEEAGLSPADEILDVGFGFGDPDLYWLNRFSPKRIAGVNITPSQAELAQRRLRDIGVQDRILLGVGSATRLPFGASCFDKVLSLEAAFHFDTREDFFAEALRVLRPGGCLALADLLPMPGGARDVKTRLGSYLGRSFWQIPAANLYDRDRYAEKLSKNGFVNVRIRSIRDRVFEPFARFARRRLDEPEVIERFHGPVRAFWKASVRDPAAWDGQDYVIAYAERPL